MRRYEITLLVMLSVLCCITFLVGFSELQNGALEPAESMSPNPYYYSGGHAVASSGYVFVSYKKGYYYFEVAQPENYQYMSKIEADRSGFQLDPSMNTLN